MNCVTICKYLKSGRRSGLGRHLRGLLSGGTHSFRTGLQDHARTIPNRILTAGILQLKMGLEG